MLTNIKPLVVFGLITISTSCASIVSKTKYPVTIDSAPRGASVTIVNKRGDQVYTGVTPSLVKLKSGGGFFQNAIYTITLSKEGFTTKTIELKATLNGWYFGNVLFGGLLGLLIIDPATGAMYKLKITDVNETLLPAQGSGNTTSADVKNPGLRIYDINEIPASWKSKLEAIQ